MVGRHLTSQSNTVLFLIFATDSFVPSCDKLLQKGPMNIYIDLLYIGAWGHSVFRLCELQFDVLASTNLTACYIRSRSHDALLLQVWVEGFQTSILLHFVKSACVYVEAPIITHCTAQI